MGRFKGCQQRLKDTLEMTSAAVTDDYESQKVIEAPQGYRLAWRCVVSLLVLAVLGSSVIWLFQSQPDQKLSREQLDSTPPEQIYPSLPPATGVLVPAIQAAAAALNDRICPCSNTSFSWSSFITFYAISMDSQGNVKQSSLNTTLGSSPTMCESTVFTFAMRIVCNAQIRAITRITDMRTYIEAPSLLPPALLYKAVQLQMSTSIQTQNDIYQFLNIDAQRRADYAYAAFLYVLIDTMIREQMKNTSYSPYDIWKSANDTLNDKNAIFNFTGSGFDTNAALGMSLDYNAYARQCNPKYCDVSILITTTTKVYNAISVVGGFVSIILLIVRLFLWPIVCKIVSFFVSN